MLSFAKRICAVRSLRLLVIAAMAPALALAQTTPSPVDVMVVGVFPMGNGNHDIHNLTVDDMLAPKRQAEIATIVDAIARFRPNKVAIERDKDIADQRYAKYLAGTLAPAPDEMAQYGFRLAKRIHASAVYGIDADGDFPYPPLEAYAKAHGFADLLAGQHAIVDQQIAEEARLLAEKGIAADLRYLNDPARLKTDNAFYRTALRIGGGNEQPGVDLLTGWYRRNFTICANLLQVSKPGDRIVVFFGAGHAFLLRQCVSETPGMRLVEAVDYLP